MSEYDKMAQKAIEMQKERMEKLKDLGVVKSFEILGTENREPGLYNVKTSVVFAEMPDKVEDAWFGVKFEVE